MDRYVHEGIVQPIAVDFTCLSGYPVNELALQIFGWTFLAVNNLIPALHCTDKTTIR